MADATTNLEELKKALRCRRSCAARPSLKIIAALLR